MLPHDNKTRRALHILVSALPVLLLTAFSQGSHAILLKIDAASSEIRYTPLLQFCYPDSTGSVICPPAPVTQTFAITGNIEVDVIHEHWDFGSLGYADVDRDLLSLKPGGLSSGAFNYGFSLPDARGLMDGQTFEVSDDPCFLFVGPGGCSGGTIWFTGTDTGSEGTWDGQALLWSGYQSSFFSSFSYTIKATVAAVPEPGTLFLVLLMPALLFLSAGGRHKRALVLLGGIKR